MCAILDGAATPTAEDLAERNTYHRTYTAKDAPLHLGDEARTPDPSLLPPPMARLMAAMGRPWARCSQSPKRSMKAR